MTVKSSVSILFMCLVLFDTNAQKDFKGVVIDAETNEFLPYVNIGIFNKGIGTVSDEKGVFHLEINPSDYTQKDTLIISTMGYKTIKFPVPQLVFTFNEYPKVVMRPELLELNEVIVTDKGSFPVEKLVGYESRGSQIFGYWSDDIALGGELATKIKVKKGLRRLERFSFDVRANASDSILVRVNVYDQDGDRNFPKTSLNTSRKEILYTIRKNAKICEVDMVPYDIYVKDDFIIGLELLKVYGNKKINLILGASDNAYTVSYRRYASQAAWKRIGSSAMAYSLKTTYYSKKKPKPNKTTKKDAPALTSRRVSGFVFFAGQPQTKVSIMNLSTGEQVHTNVKGRYSMEGNPKDVLVFEALGMKKLTLNLQDKTTVNVNMERE